MVFANVRKALRTAPGCRARTKERRWLQAIAALLLAWMQVAACGPVVHGDPLTRRYTSRDFHVSPNLLSVAVDASGYLFVGSTEGVLRYDGARWETIPLPGNAIARVVAIGADDHVYLGSYDTFGELRRDGAGNLAYAELLTAVGLRGSERDVGIVWQVVPAPDGVYFRTEAALFYLSYDRRHSARWPMTEKMRSISVIGGEVYIRIGGTGLCHLEGDRWVPVPGAAAFAEQTLAGIVDKHGWLLLVGEKGLYRSDDRGIVQLPEGRELDGFNGYETLALPDGSLAVANLAGYLMRFGPDLHVRERVHIGNYGIVALETDRQGGLWAATEGDLVRVKMPSAWSLLGGPQGLAGTVIDFEAYDGALWLATSRGFVRVTQDGAGETTAESKPWIDYEAYEVAASTWGLLLGHRNGLLVLDPGASGPRALFEADQEGVFELKVSRHAPDVAFGLSEKQLFVLRVRSGRWQVEAHLPLEGASAGGLLETAPGVLWFGDGRGGPQRWTFDARYEALQGRTTFGATQGIEIDPDAGSFIFELDGHVFAVSGSRAFRFDGERFHPDRSPPLDRIDRMNELVVESTPIGDYAFDTRSMLVRRSGSREWVSAFQGPPPTEGFGTLHYNADGTVRVSVWTGLLQFDPSEDTTSTWTPVLDLERASIAGPDGRTRASNLASGSRVEPGSRLLVRPVLVDMDGEATYRYRLQQPGAPKEAWSEWGDAELIIRAETPGSYVLSLQGRAADGRSTSVVAIAYEVLPYWYQTTLVRFAVVVASALALFLLVRAYTHRRTRRLLAANRLLEDRVHARTLELEEANDALVRSNEQLVASREEVVNSGKRADLIFRALNDALAGTVLDEHYRIEQRIGFGGFGTVYRATELHMDNVVAIKVFKPMPGHDEQQSLERFRAEGHSAFRVNHPNAVRVLDFGICMEAVAYLVMEFLDGESLSERLRARRRLPPREVLRVLQPMAEVLAHAHEVGVIHRDVKPNNVLICREHDQEVVKLIDFGIAKVLDGATPNQMRNLTATGLLMGTPNYMAPERFMDQGYDGKSDVYSLGVIAYEMLAGARPFPDVGENYLPVALQHVNEAPPPLPAQVPAALAELVMQLLIKRPQDRPGAQEVAMRIAALVEAGCGIDLPDEAAAEPGAASSPAPSTQVFGTPRPA